MKTRLDTVLVQRGFFSSRSQAAAAVLAGEVSVNGQPVSKAGAMVAPDVEISLKEEPRFVSRGGLKLETAFEQFDLNVTGAAVIDAGASAGGFTDCLLQHGARKVIAVDVGYGQLDWKLRNDPRVEVHERTNIRGIEPGLLSEAPGFATFDLSFISLKKVLPPVIKCLKPGFELVALIKPQFEAGKGKVGSGGVVRDPETHRRVLTDFWEYAESLGLTVRGLAESGIRGPKGNVEFLIHLADDRDRPEALPPGDADSVIAALIDNLAER
ncbi:MAG: TlyA family RNA methyltransferase [Actinobacteria bacterium]|nr:TlyA family RNA methyltransferase [Actinomycetota bacterium]